MGTPVTVAVRPLRRAEIVTSARLHRQALDMEFLARFGPRFLRAYHRAWIDSPQAIALAAVDGDEIVGVLLGSMRPAVHYRAMVRRHGASLALSMLTSAMARPPLARQLLVTRGYRYGRGLARMLAGSLHDRRRGRSQPPVTTDTGALPSTDRAPRERSGPARTGEVTHLMVRPDARGAGVGRALLERAEHEARRCGLDELVLVTPPDLAATAFYDHLGWKRTGQLTSQSGEQFLRYRFDLRL